MRFAVIKKKSLILGVAAVISLALVFTAVWSTGAYVVQAGKSPGKLPVYCVDREDGKVAITFDASWGAERTDGIVNTVLEHKVKATFFTVNLWAEKYPEKLKMIADSGAFEIGLHSATHPHMTKLNRTKIKQELESNFAAVERIAGVKAKLFRAPFGEYNDAVIEEADSLGLKTIQWDVDSLDWKDLSSGEIAGRIVSQAKSGSIILMHNDGKHTLEALPSVIEGLLNKGFELVTVSELIYQDGYNIDHTGKQIKINT